MELETALQPVSGSSFLESPRYDRISAELKDKFINLYRESGDMGASARAVGVDPRILRWHRTNDPVFKRAVDDVMNDITDQAEGKVREFMLRPGNVIDRMAWLRARRPEVWNPDKRVQVDVNVTQVKESLKRGEAYEAELVSSVDQTVNVLPAVAVPEKLPHPPPPHHDNTPQQSAQIKKA